MSEQDADYIIEPVPHGREEDAGTYGPELPSALYVTGALYQAEHPVASGGTVLAVYLREPDGWFGYNSHDHFRDGSLDTRRFTRLIPEPQAPQAPPELPPPGPPWPAVRYPADEEESPVTGLDGDGAAGLLASLGYGEEEANLAAARATEKTGAVPLRDHFVMKDPDGTFRVGRIIVDNAVPQPWASPAPPPGSGLGLPPSAAWPDLTRDRDVTEILAAVAIVDAHLDAAAPEIYRQDNDASRLANRWRRIAAGPASEGQEAVDALCLATGGNPRKGVTGDDETIKGELGDTVVAALLAIQSMTKDTDATWDVVMAALAKALGRVPRERPEP